MKEKNKLRLYLMILAFFICLLIVAITFNPSYLIPIFILLLILELIAYIVPEKIYEEDVVADGVKTIVSNSSKSQSQVKLKKQKLINTIEEILTELDNINDLKPPCKNLLFGILKNCITKTNNKFDDLTDEKSYIRVSYSLIHNFAYDLVISGKYHIYRGVLNDMTEGIHLYKVCLKCFKWALNNNELSNEEYYEQLEIFEENIKNVG